jgi:hypothetical protein
MKILNMPDSSCLSNDDIIALNNRSWRDNPIQIKFVVSTKLPLLTFSVIRLLKDFVLVLGIRVSSEKSRSEKSTIN